MNDKMEEFIMNQSL